ncbi:sister chromatid cohesion protein PDS5 homolog A [Andrographis paniculata]|uniref:sister chromatid cohesion protein PDS5 homolog A n=1 Tax=Andrographis paniculata TaxID=175694 RepID=UPI0021E9A291|nr:sister chromatid cohesion protein PDS5 homolog A [Andrographis paniculata]
MAQKLQQQLKELGSKLENPPASKDALMKLVKQGAACLSEIDQTPPKPLLDSMQPLLNAIAKPELLKHQDREVKLFVASCVCEITRITAPDAPYDDDVLKDIFQLIVSTLSGLTDINSPTFPRRVVILETLAKYRLCVVMLDLECDDLIKEMFETFFTVASDQHPENVLASMQTIVEVVLEESEDVPENLLHIILSILGRDKEDITLAARRLAMNVIENCAAKLEPDIKQFLVSSMSGDDRPGQSQINYHGVLYNIYRCAPQILSGVVPYLTGELLSDQLEIRLKAVRLVGDLFALPESTISEAFKPVFLEFLKRLTDRVVEVRMSVLEYVKICLLENPVRTEAPEIISALCDRLMDYDENVRKQVVSVVCDVACHALTSIPVETVKLVSERLRDKSLLVKRYTMERLADIYRVSCMKQSSGSTKDGDYDWIVGKILRCFYDKDFRSDAIEPILSLSLFPADFSVKDKVKVWLRVFSGFDKVEVKALEKILEQKQRLQQEMQRYLSLRESSQESDGTENQNKIAYCFRVMSHCFTDLAKAQENFQLLDQLKDSNIWKILKQLIDPNTTSLEAVGLRDELLKILGQKHQLYEFLRTLSLKCSHLLFDKDHVKEILLEVGVQRSSGSTEPILSCMTILVILARFCPLLLGGIEEDLVHLLEDDNEIIKEGTLHVLAKAGGTIREQLGVSTRSLDLILERICIEGSRRQAKYAVHALASITKDDGLMSLSVLYKRLVDMLEEKSNLPAVLQSLGCIAQAAMPVFETRESEVQKFIKENILNQGHVAGEQAGWDDRSELCSLKIFGIKALVKSYLPVKDALLRGGIDDIVGLLKNILLFGDMSSDIESSVVDRAHLKLAAAKAVLRLSKHWEHKIPVDVLYLTLRTAADDFPEVKRLLLSKVHQYVRDRILDAKYACAFLLDISSSQSDLEENKRHLSDIIQMCRQGRGRQVSLQTEASTPVYPEYILPYVVHSLAHHPTFPNIDECKDVKTYEPFYRQLYIFLSMLLNGEADGKSDTNTSKVKEGISLLNSMFRRIRQSEDAHDATNSKNLYALCDLGMPIIKRFAPNQDELQDLTSSVVLPIVLYKPLEKKEEDDSMIGEEKTWLADDGILAQFESLELEENGIIQPVMSEDDAMKDSETEGSELPLGKLMKHLKAKASKAKKEANNVPTQAGVTDENDFDILKMVKEINSEDPGRAGKYSNGHGHTRKKRRSDHDLQKSKILFNEPSDAPPPKHRKTSSSRAHKIPSAASPKGGSKKESVSLKFENSDEKAQSSSESQSVQEKTSEPAEFEIQTSRLRKKSSTSKKKGKRTERDYDETPNKSVEAKKPKKVSGTGLGSGKKQSPKNLSGLAKCSTEDNGSSAGELVGCRIKVWWPMDKKYYEGSVKSYDSEKHKHVVLYDDGDVEVLRLEKERWEIVDSAQKTKKSGSSKVAQRKGGSSGQKKKPSGGPKQEALEEKSPPQIKKKRTPRKNLKQKLKTVLKGESSKKSGESPDVMQTDDSESEKEEQKENQKAKRKKPSSNKQEEDNADKDLSDADKPEGDGEKDPVDTQSDNKADSPHHGSDNEAVSSSDKKPSKTKEESAAEELSDDEPLSVWKKRSVKK